MSLNFFIHPQKVLLAKTQNGSSEQRKQLGRKMSKEKQRESHLHRVVGEHQIPEIEKLERWEVSREASHNPPFNG